MPTGLGKMIAALLLVCCLWISCGEDQGDNGQQPAPHLDSPAILTASFFPPAISLGRTGEIEFESCVRNEYGIDALAEFTLDLTALGLAPVDLLGAAQRSMQGEAICFRYRFQTDGTQGESLCMPLSLTDRSGADDRACPALLSGFSWGVVFSPVPEAPDAWIPEITELGVRFAKFWMDWSAVQQRALYYNADLGMMSDAPLPGYAFPLPDLLDADPALIDQYAFPERGGSFAGLVDWGAIDRIVDSLTAAGISPLPLIGDATTAPYLILDEGCAVRLAPEEPGRRLVECGDDGCVGYEGIGRDQYLGQIALHAAGAARRYRGRIHLWNTENELNWTAIHVLAAGWRKGEAWFDASFKGRLLEVLRQSIRLGDPFCLTTMNLNVHDPLWLTRLEGWKVHMDIVGLGAYPNYLFARPVLSGLLTRAVRSAAERGGGRPVMVLETGYPTGPALRGYGERLQCRYHDRAARGAIEQGGAGYVLFRLEDLPDPVPWWNLQAVEHHWGLVGTDGRRKQAYPLFRDLVAAHR